jgi:2-oxo-4-hydroxy-4-carboxy-5-ureidoimidazoline decarboxylase
MADSQPSGGDTSWLAAFNAAPADAAERDVLAWCASRAFAAAIADGRPYLGPDALLAAIDAAFKALTWDDILESMEAHPRIGDRTEGVSAAEQAGAAAAGDTVRQALASGNVAYEKRFGHVFLICASGLSGQEMLDQLQVRLGNDDDAERAVVRQELEKITRLRMTKLLSL